MTPVFGTAAVLVAPSAPLLASGYVAGNSLAAQNYNWMWYHLTKELNNLLAAAGVTQNTLNDSQLVQAIFGVTVLSSGSPYTLAAGAYSELIIKATPYTVNLPAATGSGNRVKIVDAVVGSSLVTITPNGTDKIGPAGNVSIFLQNNDQGQNPNVFQNVELLDALAGYWVVVAGVYVPHQTVDTDGSQLYLGRLRHLPLGNTTSRLVAGISSSPSASAWSSAIQVTGNGGVPTGAKSVKLKVGLTGTITVTGAYQLYLGFSDNNSNVPSSNTSHPQIASVGYGAAGTQGIPGGIVDVLLNSLGQFYIYNFGQTNLTGNAVLVATPIAYYMGD